MRRPWGMLGPTLLALGVVPLSREQERALQREQLAAELARESSLTQREAEELLDRCGGDLARARGCVSYAQENGCSPFKVREIFDDIVRQPESAEQRAKREADTAAAERHRSDLRALVTVQGPFNGEWRAQFKGHTVAFASGREEALDKAALELDQAGAFPFNTGEEATELLYRMDRRKAPADRAMVGKTGPIDFARAGELNRLRRKVLYEATPEQRVEARRVDALLHPAGRCICGPEVPGAPGDGSCDWCERTRRAELREARTRRRHARRTGVTFEGCGDIVRGEPGDKKRRARAARKARRGWA